MADDEVTLATISSQIAGLGNQMAVLAARVLNIETAMNVVLQDGRKLHALSLQHTRMFTDMHRDIRMMRSAVNDLGRENVTPGEIASIHTDLDRHNTAITELQAAVAVLESK